MQSDRQHLRCVEAGRIVKGALRVGGGDQPGAAFGEKTDGVPADGAETLDFSISLYYKMLCRVGSSLSISWPLLTP